MRRIRRSIVSGLVMVSMMFQGWGTLPVEGGTYNKIVEITEEEQVVDSYRGVDAIYRKNAYETELPWNCAGYVRSFYQEIYGVNVTNLFRGQTPNGNKDGQYVEFAQVISPKKGDICGEVKENTNHWTIVRKVLGDTIVVIEQNYKWVSDDKIYCQIKRKVNYTEGDYRFYRLASKTSEAERVTTEASTEENTEKTTEKSTEKSSEATTKKPTEKSTEKTTKKSTEKSTEKTTKKSTEKSTEKTTKKSTEKSTEKETKKSAEKSTEKAKKKTTKKTTKKKTEKTTEKVVEKVLLSNITEITVNPKASFELSATYEQTGKVPKTLTFSSSDESVVKVDEKGKVVAQNAGVALVTISAPDGKTSCFVKVNGIVHPIIEEPEQSKEDTKKTTEKSTKKATKKLKKNNKKTTK